MREGLLVDIIDIALCSWASSAVLQVQHHSRAKLCSGLAILGMLIVFDPHNREQYLPCYTHDLRLQTSMGCSRNSELSSHISYSLFARYSSTVSVGGRWTPSLEKEGARRIKPLLA